MKMLEVPHKVCATTCMVNGLEDLYEWHTGQRLPDYLFFHLSGLGTGFTYLKNKNALAPRITFWGNSTQRQYAALAGVVGFRWQVREGRGFPFSLQQVKELVDRGKPVVLGALDMFHLPYFEKFYHRFHIPIHYVLMVGYDDAGVWVHDCDRPEAQRIPYRDLEQAWNVDVPGISLKNTFFVFQFGEDTPGIETIVTQGLQHCAEAMLKPPAGMFGVRGMRKLAEELPLWPQELNAAQLDASLRHLAEYTGFPPMLPDRLTGFQVPNVHAGARDNLAKLLKQLAAQYQRSEYNHAAELLGQAGKQIEALTEQVVDFILRKSSSLDMAAESVRKIAVLEEEAYGLLAG